MKVLCLYHNKCALELFEWIRKQGHEIVLCSAKLDIAWCREQNFGLTVSYTYRHILSAELLDVLNHNAVNIHNAYLPWNRGADPNIWSIIDSTPRGVTLHYMDTKIDCGDIIAQTLVLHNEAETLSSAYMELDAAAKKMFKEAFSYYPFWNAMRKRPVCKGTYHSVKDGALLRKQLHSFEISVSSFKNMAVEFLEKERK